MSKATFRLVLGEKLREESLESDLTDRLDLIEEEPKEAEVELELEEEGCC